MAWRSGGDTNDEMCDQLSQNRIITKPDVLEAFRRVDRGLFVPEDAEQNAYDDAPLRHNGVHMSAPHIYGSVMDALEMKVGHSFLNIGSGTGYISSIAAVLGGPTSLNHGIEINRDVHEFAAQRTEEFRKYYLQKFGNGVAQVRLCCGNVFDLEEFSHQDELPAAIAVRTPVLATRLFQMNSAPATWASTTVLSSSPSLSSSASVLDEDVEVHMQENEEGESATASSGGGDSNVLHTPQRPRSESSLSSSSTTTISSSVSSGGGGGSRSRSWSMASSASAHDVIYDRIYVGASCSEVFKQRLLSCLALGGILVAPVEDQLVKILRIDEGPEDSSFVTTVLCCVRFVDLTPSSGSSPNIRLPKMDKLPRTQWSPQTHVVFPKSFKRSCFAVLTAARHDETDAHVPQLPHVLWLEILSYTSRGWFEKDPTETDKLTLKLAVEVARREKAEKDVAEARRAQRAAEEECSRWRGLTHRLERQLRQALDRESSMSSAAAAAPAQFDADRSPTDREDGGGLATRRHRLSFGNFFLRGPNLISFAANAVRPPVREPQQHLDDEVEDEEDDDEADQDEFFEHHTLRFPNGGDDDDDGLGHDLDEDDEEDDRIDHDQADADVDFEDFDEEEEEEEEERDSITLPTVIDEQAVSAVNADAVLRHVVNDDAFDISGEPSLSSIVADTNEADINNESESDDSNGTEINDNDEATRAEVQWMTLGV